MDRRQAVERRGVWSGSECFNTRRVGPALRLSVEGADFPAKLAAYGPARGEYGMRGFAAIVILMLLPALLPAGNKLTFEDRIELTRGLTAEYATVKALLPRSRKPLEFEAKGEYDKQQWAAIAKESGPAARNGDLVQVTKIEIDDDKIVLQINGGYKGGRKWYQGVQIGMGGSTAPISGNNNDTNAPGGTSIAVLFHKPLEPVKAAEIKKL